MYGPEPRGHWTGRRPQTAFQHLKPGGRFEVFRPFTDFDGKAHPAGESWTFVGHNFLPYDDGLSLFVSLDGEHEWHIRLQWRPDQQGPVIDHLERYVRKAPTPAFRPWDALSSAMGRLKANFSARR